MLTDDSRPVCCISNRHNHHLYIRSQLTSVLTEETEHHDFGKPSNRTRRYGISLICQYLSSWISPLFQPTPKELQDDGTKPDETLPRHEDVTLESEISREDTEVTEVPNSEALKSNNPLSVDGFKVPSLPTHVSKNDSTKTRSAASTSAPTVEEEEDIDAPPQFPLPDSAQRSRAPAPKIETTKSESASVPSFNLAPPSPDRENDESEPLSDLNIAITPGTIPLGNMAPPPSTTSRPDFGMQQDGGGLTAPGGVPEATRKRAKVALGPGYSPLDWARLTQSGRNLRGIEGPMRVTVAELAKVRGAVVRTRWICVDILAQYSTRCLDSS